MSTHKRRAFLKSAGLGALTLSLGQRTAWAADSVEKLILGVLGTGSIPTSVRNTYARWGD